MNFGEKSSTHNWWEYIVPALAVVSLTVSCTWVSSKKLFWNDELLSYYLLSDQSFKHMMIAFSDKFTNVPPLYFVMGWLWAKVFGPSELSLRIFSSLGISTAFLIIWITLRRTYNFWSASIGTVGVFCFPTVILYQNAEARMYGLFLTLCSLGIMQFDAANKMKRCSNGFIISNACIHVAIVLTHLFGVFYSGAILAAFFFRDSFFKFSRPKIYLSIVISWLSFIPYIPTFLKQADAGNPRGWISVPNIKNLITFYGLSSSPFPQVIFLVLLTFLGVRLIYNYRKKANLQIPTNCVQDLESEISLLILAYFFLAVPLLVWIISREIKPIFVDRYMIPSYLGWAIFLAYFSSRAIYISGLLWQRFLEKFNKGKILIRNKTSVLFLIPVLFLLFQPIKYAKSMSKELVPGLTVDQFGYKELPIVTPFSHDFIKRIHYSSQRGRYFYVLDWEAALDTRSGLFSPQEYKTMEALKRSYPRVFQKNIVPINEFLKTYDRFLVLDYLDYSKKCNPSDFHCPWWLETRVKDNAIYNISPLGPVEGRELLLVESKI